MWIDVALRHQSKRATGSGENRRDNEIDGDDPVRRDPEILDAQIVFPNGKAGEAKLRPKQGSGGNAGEPGGFCRVGTICGDGV